MKKAIYIFLLITLIPLFFSCKSIPEEEQMITGERNLIINADDLCFDRQTNEAIIKCYTQGIVTSTTAYVNFPESIELLKEVHKQFPDFPIGIHLNITFGKPVLPAEEVPTLINKKNGNFWNEDQILSHIADMAYDEVKKEVRAQIKLFMDSGVPLDHIDYHNHLLALYTPYHQIVREVAAEYNLPIRNPVPISVYKKIKVSSGGGNAAATAKLIVYGMLHPFKAMPMMKKVGIQAFIEQEKLTRELGIKTPDWFVDVFYENATTDTFKSILSQLPQGTSEIMCHPGSSENEILILIDSDIKDYLSENDINLSTFGNLQ